MENVDFKSNGCLVFMTIAHVCASMSIINVEPCINYQRSPWKSAFEYERNV